MKIVDCFTFYNEMDLLQYRLATLYEYVDFFILIEANTTHAGHPKPTYYVDNMHLFEKYRHKIIHMVSDLPFKVPAIDYSKNEQWKNENFQRNCIKDCVQLETLGLSNGDLVIISDLDEIIDPQRLTEFRDGRLIAYKGFSLSQDMYYYNLHCKNTWFWSKAKIVTYEYLLQNVPEDIRQGELPLLERGGWHLSYFGDAAFIRNKLLEFGHQEYNSPEYTDENNIIRRLENGVDLFGRGYVHMTHVPINQNPYLPPLYHIYLTNYVKNNEAVSSVPIYVYYHLCCIANWRNIFTRMMFKLKNSGLYKLINEIRITVLGHEYNPSDAIFSDSKLRIRFHSSDISLYERPALNNLIDDANTQPEFYVLYMHSKGVKHWGDKKMESNVYEWCEYMFHFNVYKHPMCITELNNGANAVGCNLQERGAPLHYSGNFWWSRSSHIKVLPKIVDTYYNTPEFLVSSIDGVYKSLWHSDVNHFHSTYPPKLYENRPIIIQTMEHKNGNTHYS
uniref:Glycosyltransferase family 17 n=1 Tax=viral metagenome TaxID=1070528 RepID=A0A6C0HGT6_9ZZZZ